MPKRSKKRVKSNYRTAVVTFVVVGILFVFSLGYLGRKAYQTEYNKLAEAQTNVFSAQEELREDISRLLLQLNEMDDNRFEFIKLIIMSVEDSSPNYKEFSTAYSKFRKANDSVVGRILNQKDLNDVIRITEQFSEQFYQYNNSLIPYLSQIKQHNSKASLTLLKDLEVNLNEIQVSLKNYVEQVESYNDTLHHSGFAKFCSQHLGFKEIPLPIA